MKCFFTGLSSLIKKVLETSTFVVSHKYTHVKTTYYVLFLTLGCALGVGLLRFLLAHCFFHDGHLGDVSLSCHLVAFTERREGDKIHNDTSK